jgi:NAD(P)-dependent dehydrogenase (short-subunit alcohol dehydrogenase family)
MSDSYFRLDGTVAVLTGANQGLGKRLAVELSKAGAEGRYAQVIG